MELSVVSFDSLCYPRKSDFYGQPVQSFVEACEDSIGNRRHFLWLLTQIRPPLTPELLLRIDRCRSYGNFRDYADIDQTYLERLGLAVDSPTVDRRLVPETPALLRAPNGSFCNTAKFVASTRLQSLRPPELEIPKGALLFFDTETTGLDKESIIIQLGYILSDARGVPVLPPYERILRWPISDEEAELRQRSKFSARQVHGISQEEIRSSPFLAKPELESFLDLAVAVQSSGGLVLGHNSSFDFRMLKQSAAACGIPFPNLEPFFCTSLPLARVPEEERGSDKKLSTVYDKIGAPSLGQEHRALVDAACCKVIYFWGKQRGWWSIPKKPQKKRKAAPKKSSKGEPSRKQKKIKALEKFAFVRSDD